MIEDDRGCIDYAESGLGPTVVFVPGSCSTGSAWRPILSELGNGWRSVTTSLLGYGGTAERRTLRDADISREAEVLEAVVRRAASPVHLVGHSFGGAAAIAVALRRRVPLLSLVIIEAPVPELLRHAGEHRHYRALREMTDVYFDAFRAGETAAIKLMIDFYGGAGTFAAWPERVRRYAVDTTPVNILDWASAYDFQLTPACLANIDVPALVLRGGASHPAMRRASELLSQCMANASLATIAGAAHFMISTHAAQVVGAIAQHLAGVERSEKRSHPALALRH
jgi:pimeloyl-ACP methyl ester carboxylesterase